MGRTRSDEQRAAAARSRAQRQAVRAYLEAIEVTGPGPSARNGLDPQLADLQRRIDAERDVATRIELVRARLRREQRLLELTTGPGLDELERAFVEVAADHGRRRGISYAAWREIGVRAEVLARAGIRAEGEAGGR